MFNPQQKRTVVGMQGGRTLRKAIQCAKVVLGQAILLLGIQSEIKAARGLRPRIFITVLFLTTGNRKSTSNNREMIE